MYGKKPIKFDPEMRELQKGFHAMSKELKKSKSVDYFLMGGTLADVTLLVDIPTTGGAHLISHGLRGPPTVRLKYTAVRRSVRYLSDDTSVFDAVYDEVCFWTFVTPLPPGWHTR